MRAIFAMHLEGRERTKINKLRRAGTVDKIMHKWYCMHMRIAAFEVKDYELKDFERATGYGLEVDLYPDNMSAQNVEWVKGCEGITTLGFSDLSEPMIKKLAEFGVKFLATRTVGFNHIDLEACKKYGIRTSNAYYEPYNVADFAVMLMLMLLRKAKISVCRALVNDFSLDGMCGREMRNLTIGVIGAGKIGRAVIGNLQGFGCRVLAYDPYAKDHVDGATFVDLDTLYKESDIISLHVPLTPSNRHMIDAKAIAKMKDGVLIINTARGGLIDTDALIEALENEKIGGAGLDTIEQEEGIAHIDLRARIVNKRDVFYLKQFPNVIFTSHYAFFTEEATSAMVDCGLKSLALFGAGKDNPYEING